MVVEGNLLRIIQGPRENLHRPAIDPLFRSAASFYGPRLIGVVLSGLLDDGTAGLMVLRAHKGEAIVQNPETAMFASMPGSALEQVPDAHVLELSEIAECIVRLTSEKLPESAVGDHRPEPNLDQEVEVVKMNMAAMENEERPGQPSAFACPECGGVLWEVGEDSFLRFRCRVGHAYTARHLGAEQRQAVETALWSALRALEENASLYRRLQDRAAMANHDASAKGYEDRAFNIAENARVLRDFLLRVSQFEGEHLTADEL
jgi:two-component system chemotaxis response regulator CheB